MQNPGEEIVGCYLQHIRQCEFVQYNLQTPDVQGEIDVIGIDIRHTRKKLYVCEVAIHLVTGLQYVKDKRPDNVGRFLAKFDKDIAYAKKYFGGYEHCFMLWSPIVKDQPNAQYNQMAHLCEVRETLKSKHDIDLELVINDRFAASLIELRDFARNESKEMKSPIMRLMQVEESIKTHLSRPKRKEVRV